VSGRIQSLWIGRRLSVMEQLSIASFLTNGHEYHLYVYEEIENAPKGTVLKVADAILSESMIFQYRSHPSYAGFSNFFRYNLLLNKSGWWAGTEVVCFKPFAFEEPYVLASERVRGREVPTTAVVKTPPGSEIMAFNWGARRSCPDPSEVVWGEHGPQLMERAIAKFCIRALIKDVRVFCPLAYDEWEEVLSSEGVRPLEENTYSIHLWNEMWRRGGRNKDDSYATNSLHERLKATFLSQ
jgi:Alpha 1,4-glycosyltransferase conserved region